MNARLAWLVATVLACPASALGAGATFQLIPDAASANDMSPDGRFIVGMKTNASGGGAYILDTTTGVMTTLPPPAFDASAVSDDGTAVLGEMQDEEGRYVAALWSIATNEWTSLGFLPGGVDTCGSASSGYDLSGDGTVAIGLSWEPTCQARGFKWTQATGMISLDVVADGGNRASAISSSGAVIGGFARVEGPPWADRVPTQWSGNGSGALLETPIEGGTGGEVHGMTPSGSIMLGTWNGLASKWTNGGAVRTTIGAGSVLPGWTGHAMAIDANGTAIGFDIIFGYRQAWIHLNGAGPLIELRAYLIANGANVPEDVILEVPRRITTDGKMMIGHGFNGGWMATLDTVPPTCEGDIAPPNGDGQINGADITTVLGAWGTPDADLTGDGTTDGADITVILGNWGTCELAPGACCLDSGCLFLTAGECAQAGGEFLGPNVPCTVAGCMSNDHCADADDITSKINGPPILADNSLATPPFGGGDPELPAGTPSCQWSGEPHAAHSTIWYSFVAPENGLISINTCEQQIPFAVNDTLIAIYSGTCGSLVEMHCDDDGCPGDDNYRAGLQFAWGFTPGETYYICIMCPGGWTGSSPGPFSFQITSP